MSKIENFNRRYYEILIKFSKNYSKQNPYYYNIKYYYKNSDLV